MLARGQQGSKPFNNLSAFQPCIFMNNQPCIFMNNLSILMGILELSMRMAPIILFLISAPIFSFSKRPGRLKGRIWYFHFKRHSTNTTKMSYKLLLQDTNNWNKIPNDLTAS